MHNQPLYSERTLVGLLAAIQFVHILDFVVIMPLGPTLMLDLNIGPREFGTLVSSYNFSAAVCAIGLSAIADRFNRKGLLLISIGGFFAALLGCYLAQSYTPLLIMRILAGGFGGVLNALVYTFVTDLVAYERRGRAMGVLATSFSIASVIGIPTGLVIADFFSWHATYLFSALITAFICVLSFFILPDIKPFKNTKSPLESINLYFKTLIYPPYLKAHFFIFLVSMSMFVLIPFLSPYAVKNMGVATTDLKYMYFIGGLVTILTARLFGRLTDRYGASQMFMVLAFISILPVILYSNAGQVSFLSYIFLGTLFMTFVSGRMIPCMTMISAVPRPEDRGNFLSVMNAVRSTGTATATLISGMMITQSTEDPY